MVKFNWFSRTFNQPSEADAPAEPVESVPSEPQEQAAEADASAQEQPTSPADYLAWAKAAYQSVQAQQSAPAPSAPSSATEAKDDSPPDESAPAPESVAVEAVDGAIAESVPPLSVEEEVAPDTVPASLSEAAVTPQPFEAPPKAPPAAAAPTGPAWMQATADRQARLERLQETAIAPPEPEPSPESEEPIEGITPAPVLPDINFDESFLWSAEVLAAQGRQATDISIEEITWLNRLRQGLGKTRRGLINQLKAIVGQGPLNEDAVFEIEALLLQADVGVEATDTIIAALQDRMRTETLPPEAAIAYLKKILRDMLDAPLADSHNLAFVPEKDTFNIWLLTGVNGAGKTTTIGKLAHIAQKSDYRCLIGAADTFRAAAVEQVKAWGARSGVDVIANPGKNTDPAAVVFDAIAAAQSRNTELLLIDTAGRLQNKKNLMDELSKIRRIIDKKAPDAQVESLLVLDATLGQNGLRQAEVFSEAATLSGVVLTKLDGTAKGGVALAVVQQLGLPIRFIGAGEGIEDLRPFSSYEFVEALLSS